MTRRRGRCWPIAVAASIAATVSPVAARAASWADAGAGVPATVTLNSVAAYKAASGDVVVAVGSDSATNTAAIYRFANGQWSSDTVTGLPAKSKLVKVAVSAGAAWAVGSVTIASTTTPLVVRFPGGGAALAQPGGAWAQVAAADLPQALVEPLTVALGKTDALSQTTTGLIGDRGGHVYPLSDGSSGASVSPALSSTPAAGEIHGIAIRSDSSAVTAGAETTPPGAPAGPPPPGSGVRIFEVGAQGATAAKFSPDPAAKTLAAVISTAPTGGLAIEQGAPGLWQPDANAIWRRLPLDPRFNTSDQLADLAADDHNAPVIAGGKVAGTVWRQSGATWTRDDGLGAPLHGIAALAANDIWAVGDSGNVIHYFTPPPPPPPPGAVTRGAYQITQTSATVEGAVNPQGADTTYHFEYGTDTTYGAQTLDADAGSSTANVAVSAAVSGLSSATSYHYRLVAHSAHGTATGADQRIATLAPPTVPPAGGSGSGGGTGGSGAPGGRAASPSSATTSSPNAPRVTIDQPKPKPPAAGHAPAAPLLSDVHVQVAGRKLVITFQLTAPARVGARAKQGSRVVGHTKLRPFRAGPQGLILKFRGAHPPSNLKLTVRPWKPAGARKGGPAT